MNKLFLNITALATVLFLGACANESQESTQEEETIESVQSEGKTDSNEGIILEKNGLTLTEVIGSPEFPDSKLTLKSPELHSENGLGKIKFDFEINGGTYQLGSQSEDAATKSCANSPKGQHIHLIVNNEAYEAHYSDTFTTSREFEAGNNVVLAFISRSYHESLKHDGAYVLTQFKTGEEEMDEVDLTAPHLFYSRPKGNYEGENAKKVMLDFYLVNTIIAEGGNYVSVTIDDSTTFKITKWAPYFIEGLSMGTHTIEIQLMDNENQFIEGPFNYEKRNIYILEEKTK